MKKIFIIIFTSLFLLTGCYDNIELDNLSIITGVGIDYLDDEFKLTYEILSDTKTEENTALLSHSVSGSGKTISEAFTNTNYSVSKKAYFSHLKLLVLSEEIINNHLEDIVDYLIRDTQIRNEFKVVVAHKTTPEKILKNNDKFNPVVTEYILDLLDNEKYNNSMAIDINFQEILAKLVSQNTDLILNSLTISNETIKLDKGFIFDNFKAISMISKKDTGLYNLLTKKVTNMHFENYYNDAVVSISIDESTSSIKVTKDKINIDLNLEGKIIENNANFNLKDVLSYQVLNADFSKIIEKDVYKFIKLLQKEKSDILGLSENYYKDTRENNEDLWTSAEVFVTVNLKINTKGFIFEVEND